MGRRVWPGEGLQGQGKEGGGTGSVHVAEEVLSMVGLLRERGPSCGASKTVGLARDSQGGSQQRVWGPLPNQVV